MVKLFDITNDGWPVAQPKLINLPSAKIYISFPSGTKFFVSSNGDGLHALNHLVHRIIEVKTSKDKKKEDDSLNVSTQSGLGIIIDINGFQKKRVENIRAIAHMMGERARYFKSSIEVNPMSAFERRIVHEFLSNATDLKTESTGVGYSRRVVIKYVGNNL